MTYSKDNLPSDPDTWPKHRKTALARMYGPITETFTVETKEGALTRNGGYLAVDSAGYPYPISLSDYRDMYVPVNPQIERLKEIVRSLYTRTVLRFLN
jgi:hypothetical protein